MVLDVEFGVDIDTAVVAVTGNAGCVSYAGDEDADPKTAKGFTMGSTISVDGELLGYIAHANDPGQGQGPLVQGRDQGTEPFWI